MPNRASTNQTADDFLAVEIARDVAHCAVRVEIMAVKAAHAGSFLPTMLECMQAERDHRRCAVDIADAENAALFAQFIIVKGVGGQHVYRIRLRFAAGHIGTGVPNVFPLVAPMSQRNCWQAFCG